tara:strand:+ start:2275 stop:2496 length:222 start_codon:yes stop_codon:yes gene_type:complete
MKIPKPNQQEKTIISILLSITFGLVVGVLSMREAVKDAELERDIMMYHAEEMTEMNAVLHQMMEKKDIISDDE